MNVSDFEEVYSSLPIQKQAEIDAMIAAEITDTIWRPLINTEDFSTMTPQELAAFSLADIILYGGAAGGGKTNLICGLALTKHKRSIIYRREIKQATSISEEIFSIRRTRDNWNGQDKVFRLPGNQLIQLAGMQQEGDKQKFKGIPYDLICVGRDTPVLMADRSYKMIQNIMPGDMVETLSGPRRVKKTFHNLKKESSLLEAIDDGGNIISSQIQGRTHEVLTSSGWVSHDTLDGPRQSLSFESTQYCGVCRHFSRSQLLLLSSLLALDSQHEDSQQRTELFQRSVDRLASMGSPAACHEEGQATCFGLFDDGSPESLRLQRLIGFLEPFLLAGERALPFGLHRVTSREHLNVLSASLLEDFLENCPSYPHLCGGLSPAMRNLSISPKDAQLYLHQSAGVATPSRESWLRGGEAGTPRYSRQTLSSYDHPYTMDKRLVAGDNSFGACSFRMTPLGICDLYDIEVEDVNHYITSCGIVSKNCFDEVTDFLESQFRFVITWNRSNDPRQRCRVICTCNPPSTAEGAWIVSYWAPWLDPNHPNPALPGELRWYTTNEKGEDVECPSGDEIEINGEMVKPRSRTFIPSSVDDNPYLAATSYKSNLQSLPEPLRSQMLKGDFMAGKEDNAWQVIPTAWVEAAQARWTETKPRGLKMSALGVDPARGGRDQTILAPRYEWWYSELIVQDGATTPSGPDVAALCIGNVRDGAPIFIDVIGGAGTSPYDHMKGQSINVHAVDGRKESGGREMSGKFGFVNMRSEMWWRFREALDPDHGENIALPPDRKLLADLCTPRWTVTPRGIQVEPKGTEKEGTGIIKRLGRSPDRGDAVVYAWLQADRRGARQHQRPIRTKSNYSPHNWRRTRGR